MYKRQPQRTAVNITFVHDGELQTVAAKCVIMATPKFITARLVSGVPDAQAEAMRSFRYCPYPVINMIFDLSLIHISAIVVAAGCAKKLPTLSLLVWEGYADPSFIEAFETSHHCKVTAAYMGSSDELVAKLRGGSASNYDVISPSSDVATMIATSGLAAPLDLAKLPSYPKLSERLRSMPLVKARGQVYGVPFTWGPNPLLYDTEYFSKAPESWAVLWDPSLKGKLSAWDELSTIYMAAQVLGYDKPDPNHIYDLSDACLLYTSRCV